MKYIFKQVDNFTPSETTVEFTADALSTILEQFEMFLRGSGFQFNGNLDFVSDDECQEEVEEEHEWIQDKRADAEWPFPGQKRESIYDGDLNSPSAAASEGWHTAWNGVAPSTAMQWTAKELMKGPLTLSDVIDKCPVCHIDKLTMKNQKCWDKFCPKGNDAN